MKTVNCIPVKTTRGLVNFLNDHKIQKEDIIQILDKEGYLMLLYYEDKTRIDDEE